MLKVLAQALDICVAWPSRESLRMSMPMCFRKFFRKCAVIIDCTEIFREANGSKSESTGVEQL